MQRKILVVDDDPRICALLSDILKEHHYHVAVANTTEEAWEQVNLLNPDLILLDVEIPLKGGLEFCREIKEKEPYRKIPIIFQTVRDREIDVVSALNLGGDDFITKPFSTKELVARINVALRRSTMLQPGSTTVQTGSLYIDFERRIVKIHQKDIHLTPKEFDLFEYLYKSRHRVLKDKEIFEQVWGNQSNSLRSTVYTHINRLRRKLQQHGSKLKTIAGIGFRYDERSTKGGQ